MEHERGRRAEECGKKAKGQRTCVRCPWLVPSPRYFAKLTLLVEREQALASTFAGDGRAGRLHANHCVFERAEAADTGLVQSDRNRRRIVLNFRSTTRASGSEVVAALGAGAENAVNQASGDGAGRARSCSTKVGQSRSKTDRRISRVVGNHTSVDGTDGGDSRRLIGRH